MNLEQIKTLIASQGWTPMVRTMQRGTLYLYAARKLQGKTRWRYIGTVSKLDQITEEQVKAKLNSE